MLFVCRHCVDDNEAEAIASTADDVSVDTVVHVDNEGVGAEAIDDDESAESVGTVVHVDNDEAGRPCCAVVTVVC